MKVWGANQPGGPPSAESALWEGEGRPGVEAPPEATPGTAYYLDTTTGILYRLAAT